jgi:hypothetical protein
MHIRTHFPLEARFAAKLTPASIQQMVQRNCSHPFHSRVVSGTYKQSQPTRNNQHFSKTHS